MKTGVKLYGTSNHECSMDITKVSFKDVIVILGNEGQGISSELLELCDEMINIPLAPSCESLNVAAAASIIMWEARKSNVK